MEDKGHCRHGEFILREGCPECIAERRTAKLAEQVKAKLEYRCEELIGCKVQREGEK